MSIAEQQQLLYWGASGSKLFCCLHIPEVIRSDIAIILCYPFGQEYMRAHRTYYKLASSLAEEGMYVLRFDYFACGDSEGAAEEGNMELWLRDIAEATQCVKASIGSTRFILVGGRLGANLALVAAKSLPEIEGIVMWDPILSGRDYIEMLKESHRLLMEPYSDDTILGLSEKGRLEEALGYPVSPVLYEELSAINLEDSSPPACSLGVLCLDTQGKPELENWSLGHKDRYKINYQKITEENNIWARKNSMNKGWIATKVIKNITTWISKVSL